uniref:Uncharacterized protein n=1 Tax=Myotis myotis TaxID=51298 RepID=A0A7J8AML4_MYOMY|nr:hypothetical protein mMyoMyo1_008143 [Myotis myotis]
MQMRPRPCLLAAGSAAALALPGSLGALGSHTPPAPPGVCAFSRSLPSLRRDSSTSFRLAGHAANGQRGLPSGAGKERLGRGGSGARKGTGRGESPGMFAQFLGPKCSSAPSEPTTRALGDRAVHWVGCTEERGPEPAILMLTWPRREGDSP